MAKYELYDSYEAEAGKGELLLASDNLAAIVRAAKERKKDTDGECYLTVVKREECAKNG